VTDRNEGAIPWPNVDMVVFVNGVKLHLYGPKATAESNLKEDGIARFALNKVELRLKVLSDGASESQVVLKSLTMSNTVPTATKFREIIPAAEHDRNQFMLLYTMSGGPNSSALAFVTIDSPQIIFAVDPVVALLEFFTSALPARQSGAAENAVVQSDAPAKSQASIDFRVDLHNVEVVVLENDMDAESQAIKLSIYQILLSHQVSTAPARFTSLLKTCTGDHGVDH
jgi:vacuolar protein sorting-associated protein 13A/C